MPDLRALDLVRADAAPVRSWLAAALDASRVTGCPGCGPAGICSEHAADAVLNAARSEDLAVLPMTVADQIVEAAREQGRLEVRRRGADQRSAMPQAWMDLFEGLHMLAEHRIDDISPFNCSHDTLAVMANPRRFTAEELQKLDDLGFHADDETFYSFRFGSA